MACIRRLAGSTPKWDVIVFLGTDPSTGRERRRVKRFYSLQEARMYAARMTTQLSTEGSIPDAKITVQSYMEQWLRDRQPLADHPEASRVSLTTHSRHRELCRLHLFPALGMVKLARLTPATIESFYRDLQRTKHLSGSSVVFVHRMVHRALRDATRKGLLTRNPASSEYLDAPRKSSFTPRIWDCSEVKLFLAEARRSSPRFPIYLFALTTSARQGEILGLQWSDVSLERSDVAIRRKFYRLKIKGEPTKLIFGVPKSKNGVRTVPLLPSVVEELRKLRSAHETNTKLFGKNYASEDDLVFCQANGKPLHVRNLIVRDFLKVIERAKVPRIRFHDLRHTTATYLIALGVDPHTVSRICGHHSSSFTLERYVHDAGKSTADALKRDAVQRLEALFSPTQDT